MLRKIKFRAWCKLNNRMVENAVVVEDGSWGQHVSLTSPASSDLTYMQFTGLKDKNGKEIYEGDFVKRSQYDTDVATLLVRFGEHLVGFDSDCAISATGIGFHFEWISGGRDFLGTPYMEHLEETHEGWCKKYLGEHVDWGDDLEVIGNIYENPELLSAPHSTQ